MSKRKITRNKKIKKLTELSETLSNKSNHRREPVLNSLED